jgi:hypothetical protein
MKTKIQIPEQIENVNKFINFQIRISSNLLVL